MFAFDFLDSFSQNYFICFLFALFWFAFCLFISVRFLIRSFVLDSRVWYFCFVCLCFFVNVPCSRSHAPVIFTMLPGQDVNHFSVDNPTLHLSFSSHSINVRYSSSRLGSRDVNHLSVENLFISQVSKADVNHLSVENLLLLENMTYCGDTEQSYLHLQGFNQTVRNLHSFLNITVTSKISQSECEKYLALIICVITSLLKFLVKSIVKVSNYRLIDTHRTIFIKKRRFRSPKLRLITVFALLIFTMIKINHRTSFEKPVTSDTQNFKCVNIVSTLFLNTKGKPIRFNLFTLLILSGDIEMNPGPPQTASKVICESCVRTIAKNITPVACSNCEGLFHRKCSGITVTFHKKILQNESSYVCLDCYNNALPFPEHDFAELYEDEEVQIELNLNENLNLTSDGCLNIGHLNINGLRSKISFIKIFLRQHKFDILCLNETKIDSTVATSEISVPGYKTFRQDRNCHGGGVLIYASDHLTTKKQGNLSNKSLETLWIEIKRKNSKPIYVCSLYRPPIKGNNVELVQKYKDFLVSCFAKIRKNSEVFILGDFNCDMLKKNLLSSTISDLCKDKSLTQHVKSPTRVTQTSSTLIDLILSNSKEAIECQVVDMGLSDHSFVCIKRSKLKVKRNPKYITSRSFKNFDNEAFLDDLGSLDWSKVIYGNDVDKAVAQFNQNVLEILDRHAPLTKKRLRESSPRWVTEELIEAISKRDYLKKIASRTKSDSDWRNFKKQRNYVVNLNNRLKKGHYQRVLDDNKSNSKKLWKTLNNLVPNDKRSNDSPQFITDEEGVEITDKKLMAEKFNSFFISVGSKLADAFNFSHTHHVCPSVCPNSFHFTDVSMNTVHKLINELENDKSTGLDGICVKSLKLGSPVLSFYLMHIFNISLRTGTVPKVWKQKRVTPVFKKGEADSVNNYRPISILPITMKLFEKIVHEQVSNFLDINNILNPSQSGFRYGHSTDTAVICVSDFILDELAKGRYVGAVLVDLKKAFDTVDHKILLKKVFCYGVRDVSFDWFESYLSEREQCSVIDGSLSSLTSEEAYGVPQGSVLGPLLFLLYINDIFDCINPTKTFCHLYADDTIIVQSSKTPLSLKSGLETQLGDLSSWFYNNKLSVNTEKTEVIFFGRKKKIDECKGLSPVKFQNAEIEATSHVKYLGVFFDEHMSWERQANYVRTKAYLSLNKVRRISHIIDDGTKNLLLNALVFPHLNYCVNSWSKVSSSVTKKFDSLTRHVNRVHPMNKDFKNLCDYSTALMTFKAIKNLAPKYICDRVNLVRNIHDHDTRAAAQNQLQVRQNMNRFQEKTFANSAVSVWNNLPRDCRDAQSILLFKTKAKQHFFT